MRRIPKPQVVVQRQRASWLESCKLRSVSYSARDRRGAPEALPKCPEQRRRNCGRWRDDVTELLNQPLPKVGNITRQIASANNKTAFHAHSHWQTDLLGRGGDIGTQRGKEIALE